MALFTVRWRCDVIVQVDTTLCDGLSTSRSDNDTLSYQQPQSQVGMCAETTYF